MRNDPVSSVSVERLVPLMVIRALFRYWPVASFWTRPEIEPVAVWPKSGSEVQKPAIAKPKAKRRNNGRKRTHGRAQGVFMGWAGAIRCAQADTGGVGVR